MKTLTRLCGSVLLFFAFCFHAVAGPPPGSLDQTFIPDFERFENSYGWHLWVQRDGRVLVPASFDPEYSGYGALTRISADGSIDRNFPNGVRTTGDISSFLEQTDGKLLFAGWFNNFDGCSIQSIVRLQPDGALDTSFQPELGTNEFATHVVEDGTGRILVDAWDRARNCKVVFRLQDDGRRDVTFTELRYTNRQVVVVGTNVVSTYGGALLFLDNSGVVISEVIPQIGNALFGYDFVAHRQQDGKFILADVQGSFPVNSNGLVRIQADGTIDSSFRPPATLKHADRVFVQPDGRIIVAANVVTNGTDPLHVLRLQPNGEIDPTFQMSPLRQLSSAVDGHGRFVMLDEVGRLARLNGDGAPELPQVRVLTPDVSASETNGSAKIVFTRSGSTLGATVLQFTTEPETAQAGIDFTSVSGSVRFSAADTTREALIPLSDNNHLNAARAFHVVITNVTGGYLTGGYLTGGSNSVVRITDDEVPNRIRFAAPSFPVKETRRSAVITVIRDIGSPGTAQVRYRIQNGTARAGRDFVSVQGVLRFAERQFTNSFSVPLINTTAADGNRTAELRLQAPKDDVVLADGKTAMLAILDDESPAVVTTANDEWLRAASEGGGIITFATGGVIQLRAPIELQTQASFDTGARTVILDGGQSGRHFTIGKRAEVKLAGLFLVNGWSTNGGSIFNAGALVLKRCVFSNNVARGIDGIGGTNGAEEVRTTNGQTVAEATGAGPGGNASPGLGGAIYSIGSLAVHHSAFLTNIAIGGSGGTGGTGGLAFEWSRPGSGGNGGNGAEGRGGAVYSSRRVEFKRTTFAHNQAVGGKAGAPGIPGTNSNQSYRPARIMAFPGNAGDAAGGAVYAEAALTFESCRFVLNEAIGAPGGDGGSDPLQRWSSSQFGSDAGHGTPGTPGGAAIGGALASLDSVHSTDGAFVRNLAIGAHGGKGGSGGAAKVGSYLTVWLGGDGGAGASGGAASGGAIHARSILSRGDIFTENVAQAGTGGPGGNGGHSAGSAYGRHPKAGDAGAGGIAQGGAMYTDTSDISGAKLERNRAYGGNGGVVADPGTAPGLVTTFGSAGTAGSAGLARGGAIAVTGVTRLTQTTIIENQAIGGRGADGWGVTYGYYRYYPPSGDSGSSGASALGGGAWLAGQSSLRASVIVSNVAGGGDGAPGGRGGSSLFHGSSGGAGGPGGSTFGGGILFEAAGEILNSTIAHNICAPGQGGNGGTGDGEVYTTGGGYSFDPTRPGGAAGNVFGAGIASTSTDQLITISYSTVASNSFLSATGGVGGVYGHYNSASGTNTQVFGVALGSLGIAQVRGSIFAGAPPTRQVSAPVEDLGFNLCSDSFFSAVTPSTRISTNPRLAPLADNGGQTLTMALLPSSPAINAAPDSRAPNRDQRGLVRPYGPAPDIGAFEAQYRPTPENPEPAVPSAVVLRGERRPSGIQLTFVGSPGAGYQLESSTNLFHWMPVTSSPAQTGPLFIPTTGTTNEPQRFFRAVPAP